MSTRTMLGIPLVTIGMMGIMAVAHQVPNAGADPTITSEPTYCSGTNLGPQAGHRQDGKDTVEGSADINCDQPQFVEVIFNITGDGHNWSDDKAAGVPVLPQTSCTDTQPCNRLFTSDNHQVGGDLNGDVFTVTATVKVWTPSSIFCSGGNCYPFGTPLRTFTLPAVQAPVFD
ncbi:hypothetical protein ACP6C3_30555 [Mycolicibacterium septicum]|uniref:Secreted protein n=1 Tax=Mycolicibacterium septicum TaxID=98668 RepID=A0ABW9M528_9MYCO